MTIGLMLAMLIQSAGSAALIQPIPTATTAEEQRAMTLVDEALRKDPATRLAALNAALELVPQPTLFRGGIQCLRAAELVSVDFFKARPAILECYQLNGTVPEVRILRAFVAMEDRNPKFAAALFATAVRSEPLLAGKIPADTLSALFRQLGYGRLRTERRDLVLALGQSQSPVLDAMLYSQIVRETVLDGIEHQDTAGAVRLLPLILNPASALEMVVDRRYEPIWWQIDAWAGGSLSVQRNAFIRSARAAYAIDPGVKQRSALASVLAGTGYANEAMTLYRQTLADLRNLEDDDYDYATAAISLSRMSARYFDRNPDTALAPMRKALADGMSSHPRAITNVIPNLARALIQLDRPAEAQAVLDRYPVDLGRMEAAASEGHFVALRGCAEYRLGKTTVAAPVIADLQKRFAGNTGANQLAIACMGTAEQQTANWMARVDDPETRGGALVAMTAASLAKADQSRSIDLVTIAYRRIATRPDVKSKLAKFARIPDAGYNDALRGWGPFER